MNLYANRKARLLGMLLVLAGLLGLLPWAGAQASAPLPALRSASYAVAPEGGSGVSGVVFVADYGTGSGVGGTVVVVALSGLGEAGTHPAHFHAGDCGSGGGVVVPLEPVDGLTGLSVSVTETTYDAIIGGNHHLNVHRSPADMATIIACGEVGEGALTVLGSPAPPGAAATATEPGPAATPATAASEAGEVRSEEFRDHLRTASYGIFAVGGSGVSGQLQVADRAEGGTRITVTLVGIDTAARYPTAIYRGDCGPDRERLLELEPVPFEPGETAGITESTVAFETLAEEDNFVYVYAPDGETVVACGEVGLGANR